jgi:phosphoglycolate phosphatase
LPRPSLAEARSWIGDGVEMLIRRALSSALGRADSDPGLFATSFAAFDRCYRDNLFRRTALYPGVRETLDRLRDHGLVLGCITNKREAYSRALLDAAGLSARLSFIYGGDTLHVRKPDPAPLLEAARKAGVSPDVSLMVGDSRNDREAARASGFAFVFAAYGYAPADDPSLTDGLATIATFSELGSLLYPRGPAK